MFTGHKKIILMTLSTLHLLQLWLKAVMVSASLLRVWAVVYILFYYNMYIRFCYDHAQA